MKVVAKKKPLKANAKTGYKQTKLGRIPVGWEVKKLGDLGDFLKGKGILKEQLSETGLPCIRYGEIYTVHDFVIKKFHSFISKDVAEESEPIFHNDILFAGSGETIEDIGKAVAYVGSEKAYAGGDVVILRMDKKNDSIFLSYALNTDMANRQKRKLGQGHSVVHIYPSNLADLILPIPSPPEQQKIARILSTWDKAIEKTEQLITQKQQLKKGLMQQLLTEKSMRVKLGEVAEIDKLSLGKNTSKDYAFQYISLSDVSLGNINIKTERILFKSAPSRARRIVNKGDILMATVRPNLQGFAMINQEVKNLIASTGFAIITCTKINRDFLYQFLFTRSMMKQIEALLVGSNYPAINSIEVKNLKIPFPSEKVQRFTGATLKSCDNELNLMKRKMNNLKLQKKGLMQRLLTGEVRTMIDKMS